MLNANQFLLRPFTADDAPAFAGAIRESTATVGKWMPWAHANYSEADALAWFARCEKDHANASGYEFGIFDAQSAQLIGGCGLNQFNAIHGFCNLGYWVRASRQREGAAHAAVRALAEFGLNELKLGRIEIVIAAANLPSIAVAEKVGALREGLARNRLTLHGEFVDAYMFSLIPPACG